MYHNPKTSQSDLSRTGTMNLESDPIGDEIRDASETTLFYETFPLVPFHDNSDATLIFLRKMAEQSPTHGSCIDTISDYAIGGEFDVVNKSIAGVFNTSKYVEEVSQEVLLKYISFIESLSPSYGACSMLEIAEKAYQNLQIYGNIFLKIDLVTIAGKKFANFCVVDCEEARYLAQSSRNEIMISKSFTRQFILDNKFEIVPRWPYTQQNGNTISTMLHFKITKVMRPYYGLPRSFQSIRYQFLETQNAIFINEGFASDFTLRAFFEFVGNSNSENPDMYKSDLDFIQAISQFYRRDSGKNVRRVLYRTRANGEQPTTVKEFRRNLDYSFNESVSKETQHQIIKSHNWHPVLIGTSTAGKLGQTKEIPELTKLKTKTTVKKIQNSINNIINQALEIAGEFVGSDLPKSYSLGLREVYDDIFPEAALRGIKTQANNESKVDAPP